MILVGDVGGTKTQLEVGTLANGRWRAVFSGRYSANNYKDLSGVLRQFLQDWNAQSRSREILTDACFGVAGPSLNNRVHMTNLPWIVDGDALATEFGIARVQVLNDFEAAARGVALLHHEDLAVLQAGEPLPAAPRLVIGAGTGLGVAYLVPAVDGYQVIAGESGHAGFAPATIEQLDLWRHLHGLYGRVTTEHVVSGPGLARIYEFIRHTANARDTRPGTSRPDMAPADITRAAIECSDPASLRALDLFIDCYGEVAGNCALAVLARGGVYIAGGIAPRILALMQAGRFLAAFNAKGAHTDTMRKMPVSIVTQDRLGLLGCAATAGRCATP